MRQIELTQGKFSIIDDEDFEYISQWKWYYLNLGYAVRKSGGRANQKLVYMHRAIMCPPDELDIDHINRNRLDNRRSNLRICTRKENLANRGEFITSPYCKRGHLLDGVRSGTGKGRYCKTCKNENARRRYNSS